MVDIWRILLTFHKKLLLLSKKTKSIQVSLSENYEGSIELNKKKPYGYMGCQQGFSQE